RYVLTITTRRCACAVVLESNATTPGRSSVARISPPNLRKYFPLINPSLFYLIVRRFMRRNGFSLSPRKIYFRMRYFCEDVVIEKSSSRDREVGSGKQKQRLRLTQFPKTFCLLPTVSSTSAD